MPATTTRAGVPYPVPDDTVDVPRDVKAVADKLETDMAIDAQGTLAARPAAGKRGRYYFATDQGVVYRDDGTGWTALGPRPQSTSNGVVAGPTYAGTGGLYTTVQLQTRGLGPVLAIVSGYAQNDGVHGNAYSFALAVVRKVGGVVQDQHSGAGFWSNVNGARFNAAFTAVWHSLAAGTHDFEFVCELGTGGTFSLRGWEFSAIELA